MKLTKKQRTFISDYMTSLGKKTSPAKAAASKLNGCKGGRPKKIIENSSCISQPMGLWCAA